MTSLQHIATFMELIANTSIIGGCFHYLVKKKYRSKIPHWQLLVILLSVLTTLTFFHNFQDYSIFFKKEWQVEVGTAAPWAILNTFFTILYAYLLFNILTAAEKQTLIVIPIVLIASIILSILVILVNSGLLIGNYQKALLGVGGIGLKNLSTNETGSLAIAFFLWAIKVYELKKTKFKLLSIASVTSALVTVALTQSRTSIILIFLLVSFYLFRLNNFNYWGKVLMFIPLFSIFAYFAIDIFIGRTLMDAMPNSIDYSGIQLGNMPGSGRSILWYYFYQGFSDFFRKDIVNLVIGIGDINLIRIYDTTPLKSIGLFAANSHGFLPPHSDVLKILISKGLIGLLVIYLILKFFYLEHGRTDRTFAKMIIISFSFIIFVDMLSYCLLVVLLFFTLFLLNTKQIPIE